MKQQGKRLILSAFALTLLAATAFGAPPDTTKSHSKTMPMPAHGTMPKHGAMPSSATPPKDTIPDSIKYAGEVFDSTLLTSSFVVEVRHRLYPNFFEQDTVAFGQIFPLGEDEEYQAKIIRFNPHLGITTLGEFKKLSDTLRNPAVQVQVMKGDSIVQKSWAFYFTDAPHFRADNFFGFKLVDYHVNEQKYVKPQDRK